MNPEESVPNLHLNEMEATCSFCDSVLSTEAELINLVCYACMDDEIIEAKVNAFDDLAAATRSVLNLADIIAEDIRPGFKSKWQQTFNQLYNTLRVTHVI